MSDSAKPETAAAAADRSMEQAVLRKVTRRLIPFLFLLYVINMLDRTNVSIAKLTMLKDLDIGVEAYGLGAGLFFYTGYFFFEVPSNLMLMRTGARVWIARILVSWGLVSCCMMFVVGPRSFYALRILLGIAEAGFFPGIILYLTHWFPARAGARAVAKFMAAGSLTLILGNPISGAILHYMDRVGGLAGWQWVFFLEGIPAVVMGFLTIFYLTDRPEQAHWLTPAERDWLVRRLAAELRPAQKHGDSWRAALINPYVWLLIGVYGCAAMGDGGFSFFLPTFLASKFPAWDAFQIGLLAAAPSVVALVAMILVGMHSDRTGERRWHVACAAFAAAAGWVLVALDPSPWLFVLALALTTAGIKSMLATFWTLPMALLSGAAAAGGIALINSVANLIGSLGPSVLAHFKATSGEFSGGMFVMAMVLCAGGVLVLFARHNRISTEGASAESAEEESAS